MKAELKRELSDLLTCPVDDVDQVYDQILDVFQKRARLGSMTFFRAAEVDGDVLYDGMRTRGDGEAVRRLEGLSGTPLLNGPTLDVRAPNEKSINAFVHLDAQAPKFRGSQVERELLTPCEIHSAARLMAYRGDRFIGWLGCFRRGDQPGSDSLCRELEPLTDPICAALAAADQLRRQGLPDTECFALFGPNGKLESASPPARQFVVKAREKLVHLVRQIDAGEVGQCVDIIDGVEVRITRMEGRGLFQYLAQFVACSRPKLSPEAPLTPAQREVAEYAIVGATNAEIAETTGRSVETVKVHLRNIYERLEISGRVELVLRLTGEDR